MNSSLQKSFQWRFCLLVALVLGAFTGAKASNVDFGELQLDQTYNISDDFNNYLGTFTAPESGTVYCETTASGMGYFEPYLDAEHSGDSVAGSVSIVGDVRYYNFEAEKGTTYYFYLDFAMTAGYFTMTMNKQLSVVSNSVENNSTFSIGGSGSIEMVFNMDIALDNVVVATEEASKELESTDYSVRSTYLTLDLYNTLNAWYENGTLSAGKKFTVTVKGLRSADDDTKLYNGDGVLTLNYTAAAKPTTMVSATNGDGSVSFTGYLSTGMKFLSYFTKNNPNGKYVFTFSRALNPEMGSVYLEFGSSESGDGEYYREYLTPTFNEDNTVMTVDVTGKLRRLTDMVTSGTNYGTMVLCLSSLYDADNQYVYSTTQGSYGTFVFNSDYSEVSYSPFSDFTPSEYFGENEKLQIYVSDYEYIDYTGISFSWYENGEQVEKVVAKDALAITTSAYGATIEVTIPGEVKAKKDVTVTFADLEVADGRDHSADLSAVFNPSMKILSSAPAAGSEMASLPEDYVIKVKLDNADMSYVQYEIVDLNPADPDDAYLVTRSAMTAVEGEENTFSATNYFEHKLIKNHTYRMDVYAWANEEKAQGAYNNPEGHAYVTFSGSSEPFSFSSTKFVGITPANGSKISVDDNEFVITFDGPVNIDASTSFINLGQGMTEQFESITPATAGQYSSTWTLTVAKSLLETITSGITLSVKALDLNDKVVEGNQGTEEQSFFQFYYEMAVDAPALTFDPASGSTVESLKSITIKQEKGLAITWNGKVSLYRGVNYICDGELKEEYVSDDEEYCHNVTVTFPEEITEDGNYMLYIPEGVFYVGIEGDNFNVVNAETMVYYTIGNGGGSGEDPQELNITSVPAHNSSVEACEKVDVIFNDFEEAGLGYGVAVLTTANGDVALSDAMYGVEYNEVVQPLDGKASERGTYTVTFPAGYFILDEMDSPEFHITFTVTVGTDGVESVVADDADVRYYNMNGVEVLNPEPGIYVVVRGNKVSKERVK